MPVAAHFMFEIALRYRNKYSAGLTVGLSLNNPRIYLTVKLLLLIINHHKFACMQP